jgi:hypothetical protein
LLILLPAFAAFACSLLPGASRAYEPTAIEKFEFAVGADQGWQDTGIELQAGDRVLVVYLSGKIRDGEEDIIDGSGADYVCGHAGCCEPMPEARRSALIGRVGRTDAGVFYIGNGVELPVDSGGILFLRINDCNSGLGDNSGMFLVRVTVKR